MIRPVKIFFLTIFIVAGWLAPCFGEQEHVPSATVYALMRDGTELPTDLYYPPESDIHNGLPCILIRVPAGRKAAPWSSLGKLACHQYVIAIQDTRSAIDEEGKTLPCLDDKQDGYDAVEWLAASSFTNGKIATLGFSAAGITQLMMAPSAPPSLYCQYIGQAAGSLYHHAIFPGGQFSKNLVESWLQLYAPHEKVLATLKGQPFYNDFWSLANTMEQADQVNVPAIHYVGWYDPFLQGAIDAYRSRQENGKERAKGSQKLLIGPWNHYWPQDQTLGEYDIPAHAKTSPIEITPLRWFDHHLKGVQNGIDQIPNVTYYVMGPFDGSSSKGNVWRHADSWPVAAKMTPLYLAEDNKLKLDLSDGKQAYDFKSDPKNPVPTLGGKNLFLPSGPKDQKDIEAREDVLVFTTDPFEEDTEITGSIIVNLFIKKDVKDTDIALRLTDVYPDGRSLLILEGITRTGVVLQGKSEESPLLVPVDLETTSLVFAKGHRLRISIAGSNYPHYEVNENLDLEGKPSVASVTVLTGKETPSHILVPIVKE